MLRLCIQRNREYKEVDPDSDTGAELYAVQWFNNANNIKSNKEGKQPNTGRKNIQGAVKIKSLKNRQGPGRQNKDPKWKNP